MATIPYSIIRTRRRTLSVEVKPDAGVIVRAPIYTPDRTVHAFVLSKRHWIQRHVHKFKAIPRRQFTAGETFLFQGKHYPLEIVAGQRTPLKLTSRFSLAETHQAEAREVFQGWYRVQAKELFTRRVRAFADHLRLPIRQIKLTNARSRWGSCSSTGNLNFHWKLIMAPVPVIDYVIVHELMHRKHLNHSQSFWADVGAVFPAYQVYKNWLRKNGHLLEL